MYSKNFIYFFMLFILSNTRANDQLNSTVLIEELCIYCQTTACYCSTKELILNCSLYLLDLPLIDNCTEKILWETVDFSLRNFENFDEKKLLNLRMKHLILKSNLIKSIDDNTFDTIGDLLEEIDLEMNLIKNLSSTWLNNKLINLKKLNLASNQIELISNFHHIHLPNLEQLNLSRNFIENFPNQIHQWTSLVTLDLSFNKLSSIPRFALMGLNNLSWLSLASNRNLSCIIQDSFKYLKSLKYLDLSSTNLHDVDACIFIQLIGLKTFHIEKVSLNCTSCWLVIARKNSFEISGQCLYNRTTQSLTSLTDQQLEQTCSKTSIDCSLDYCEPGSISNEQKSEKLSLISRTSSPTIKLHTIILTISILTLIILIIIIVLIYRWRKNEKVCCCYYPQKRRTTATTAEETRRRRQHHKQIINNNPTVIESVVTHGANMNVPSYSHSNHAYVNDETSKNKRKLFNPMFADSPTSDIRQQLQQQSAVIVSNDNTSQNNYLYSEHL